MTIKEFFDNLLGSQELSGDQLDSLETHRVEVTEYLEEKYGEGVSIKEAGSKAKGTMIAESYDLDLTCYFPSTNTQPLKDIRAGVAKTLAGKYQIDNSKASAVRIKTVENEVETDYHIDVVPGRFEDGSDGNAWLYVKYGDQERMRTNLDEHIKFVTTSGCQDAVKLLKLWKVRNGVPLKTFILEILTVETLRGLADKKDFAKTTKAVLERLRDEIETIALVDPANSNNKVTDSLDAATKTTIAQKAQAALEVLAKTSELAGWRKVFDEDDGGASSIPFVTIKNPPRPHVA